MTLCLTRQAVFSENNPHSEGKQISSLGLDTPMGFFLWRLCLNGIVSEQVSHPTLCSPLLWIFNWNCRRGMSCDFPHHMRSFSWGILLSKFTARWGSCICKTAIFPSLPEPRTRGNSLHNYSSQTGFKLAVLRAKDSTTLHLQTLCATVMPLLTAACCTPAWARGFCPAKPIGKAAHARGRLFLWGHRA